jgi:hypothetical protein
MKEPRKHLPGDLKALRYLDALNAGDLEAVFDLWEEAFHDPVLERMLAELDGAMFREIQGNPRSLPKRLVRPRRRRAVWGSAVGIVAATGLLAILVWPLRDTKNQRSIPPPGQTGKEVAHQSSDVSHDLTLLLAARRDLDEAAMPRFVWPLENQLSASTPLDRLD